MPRFYEVRSIFNTKRIENSIPHIVEFPETHET